MIRGYWDALGGYTVVMMSILAGLLLAACLSSCSALPTHANDPKTCRERAAYRLADAYPDPANLNAALDTICQDQDRKPGDP